jgi:DHA1 family multidrug resistance protein-like MFS transporter
MTRDLVIMGLSLGVWGVGEGMFIYFQPLYLQKLGANPVAIGAILGALGISMTLAHIPAGFLSDKFGPRPLLWASWVTATLAAFLMAAANSLEGFVAGLLIYGLTAFVVTPMNTYVTAARGSMSVGRALTVVAAMYNLGAVIGPVLGGAVGERYGLKTVYTIGASITVISTVMIFFIRRQPAHSQADRPSRLAVIKNPRFIGLLALVFAAMFALYLPQPLTPNFLQNQRSLSLASIGQLGSLGNLGNAVLMLSLGHLDSLLAVALGQVAMAAFSLLIWQGSSMPWYGLGYFFIGGYRLCKSMIAALVRPLVHPAQLGLAYGLLETTNAFTLVLAPLLAGFLYQQNPSSIYPVSLGLIGATLLASLGLLRRRQASLEPLARPTESSSD